MAAEELTLEAFPGRTLRVALFTDVSNGRRVRARARATAHLAARLTPRAARSELLALLTSGAMEPEAAFINAAMVVNGFALQLAAHKALAAAQAGRPTTRTLHSDVVFHLSPTNHVRGRRGRGAAAGGAPALTRRLACGSVAHGCVCACGAADHRLAAPLRRRRRHARAAGGAPGWHHRGGARARRRHAAAAQACHAHARRFSVADAPPRAAPLPRSWRRRVRTCAAAGSR
jgi:hypothetical protein